MMYPAAASVLQAPQVSDFACFGSPHTQTSLYRQAGQRRCRLDGLKTRPHALQWRSRMGAMVPRGCNNSLGQCLVPSYPGATVESHVSGIDQSKARTAQSHENLIGHQLRLMPSRRGSAAMRKIWTVGRSVGRVALPTRLSGQTEANRQRVAPPGSTVASAVA